MGDSMKKSLFLSLVLIAAMILMNQSAVMAASTTVKIGFEGQAPVMDKVKMDADPKCKMMHPGGSVSDEVVVNANGTLKNVFVYVKEGFGGKKFDTPKEVAVLDQVGCAYNPKILGVMSGQPIEIRNSDDTLHNVHALPTNSPQFNLGMPIKGMKLKKSFAKPEVMVKVKCEVHPWMRCYIGVVDNPYFGSTGDEGTVVLKDLPAGEYTIEAWHEKYGIQSKKVTVADADQTVDLTFKA